MTQSQTVNVTVEIDRELQVSGEAFFRSLGVNFSTGINALLKQAIQEGKKTIDDEPEPPGFVYSAELETQDTYFTRKEQAELRRRIAAVEAGEYIEEEIVDA